MAIQESNQPFSGKRVLILSFLAPLPATSGVTVRVTQLLQWLRSRGFHLTYLLQNSDQVPLRQVARLGELVDVWRVVQAESVWQRLRKTPRRLMAKVVRRLAPDWYEKVRAKPKEPPADAPRFGSLDDQCWPATEKQAKEWIAKHRPDLVISIYGCFNRCFDGKPSSTFTLCDSIEIYSRDLEQYEAAGIRRGFLTTADNEQAVLGRADGVIAIQKNDQATLEKWFPEKPVVLVESSFESVDKNRPFCFFRRSDESIRRGSIFYVASNNPFNENGLLRFINEVWPTLRQRYPEAELRVAGSLPLHEHLSRPGFVGLGRLSTEALLREYQTAHVVINPQLAGTGLKIKCVEALSAGCPLVVYPAGADGLEELADRAFLLAKSPAEFSAQILSLFSNGTLRESLEKEARAAALARFSTAAVYADLEQLLKTRLS